MTDPPGLTGAFNADFLYSRRGVLMEGSGIARNGDIITIDWNRSRRPFTRANLVFTVDTCYHTASGVCAVAGSTCAVDPTIVPMGPSRSSPNPATIRVDTVGDRVAEDTGDLIQGRHIDLYVQDTRTANQWGNETLRVRFIQGGGSCD